MSGIGVIYNLNKKSVEADSLLKIKDKLKHRGLDHSGIWHKGEIGFVHLMTRTTPQSFNEHLPARNRNGVHFITCDARIDNRADLIEQLSLDEKRADEITDSRIIFAAYEKWGEDCPAFLIGDYVFAIWDDREKKLFAARDPLGVKHFYYFYEAHKIFALASEIKSLFVVKGIEREFNENYIGDYLVLNSEDKESTFFKNIKRLPATHSLTVSDRGFSIRKYWQPSSSEIKLKNDREYQEAFREKLTEATVCRLRSAETPGSFLSGGLDSSAIVCIAGEYLKNEEKPPLKTFSAIFPTIAGTDTKIDERNFMQSVIDKSDCESFFVNVDDDNPLREMEKIFWHTDHPVGAPNVYMDCEIYAAAQKENVRVLLSGTDGDSTVSYGYEDFSRLAYRGMYLRLFRDAVALSRNMPQRNHAIKRSLWHRGIKTAVSPSLINLWRIVRRRKPSELNTQPISPIKFPLSFEAIKPEIREAFEIEERAREFQLKSFPPGASHAESHWYGLTCGHFSMMLEQLEKISAAYGIEARYPFFDRRLIEFCIALPPGQRVYKGWTRSIFRHAMEGILPKDVQWRTDKSDIGASVKINLLKYGFNHLEDAIRLNSDVLEKYLNIDVLREAYRDYKSEPLYRDREAMLILTSVYLSNWLRHTGFA